MSDYFKINENFNRLFELLYKTDFFFDSGGWHLDNEENIVKIYNILMKISTPHLTKLFIDHYIRTFETILNKEFNRMKKELREDITVEELKHYNERRDEILINFSMKTLSVAMLFKDYFSSVYKPGIYLEGLMKQTKRLKEFVLQKTLQIYNEIVPLFKV